MYCLFVCLLCSEETKPQKREEEEKGKGEGEGGGGGKTGGKPERKSKKKTAKILYDKVYHHGL